MHLPEFTFTEEWSIECDSNIPHSSFKDIIDELKVSNDIKFLHLATKYVNHMMIDYIIAIKPIKK
jgi:hypothetical protein